MILEQPKYSFSGHDSFQCRQLWLKKGFDFVKTSNSFNDEDAVVKLGVGKNMVASIRYWMKAFGIIDTKDKLTEFGLSLLSDDGWDPFLEDDASLWLLHYQLVKTNIASIYSIIFNEFRKEKIVFNKDSFLNYLKRRREIEERLSFNDNTIADDFVVFIKMYQGNHSSDRDPEDSFSGILSELDLLRTIGKGRDEHHQIENSERDTLPAKIVLYSILDNPTFGTSISLSSLEYDINSPGSVFALNRIGLMNKITELLHEDSQIVFTDHAGIKELQFKTKPTPKSVLESYYNDR